MADGLAYEILEGAQALTATDEVLRLCRVLFPDFTDAYLLDRLLGAERLMLLAARGPDGALLGFKLGYARSAETFYSWLGGIHPSIRRQGVGRELMQRQHTWARGAGYAFVETRTRATNHAMLILNLQSGFHVAGYEDTGTAPPVVIQRAHLHEQPEPSVS